MSTKQQYTFDTEGQRFERKVFCCFATWKEVLLSVLCLALAVTSATVLALYVMNQTKPIHLKEESEKDICTTTNCVNSASFVVRNMDFKANPCIDFYQYACGGFLEREEIPDDRSSVDYFVILRRDLESILRKSLEKPVSDADLQSVKNAKVFHQSCIKEEKIEQLDLKPLLDVIKKLGGVPAVDNSTPVPWYELVGRLREYNNRILISLSIAVDDRNSTRHILKFDQSDLGLPDREYYLKEPNSTALRAYYDFGVNVLKEFPGANITKIKEAMRDVVNFETTVARLMQSVGERRNVTAIYNKLTLQQMTQELPGVNWVAFVKRFYPDDEITPDEEVLNFALEYHKKLLQTFNATRPEVVSNYLMWRFIMNRANNLGQKYRLYYQEYRRALYGKSSEEARWRTCTAYLQTNMNWIVGRMFIEDSFDKSALGDLDVMIENLKASFQEMLDKNEWMDQDAKRVAKDKVTSMGEHIGYPRWLFNDTLLDTDYKEYVFDEETYFENVLKILKEKAKENFSFRLREVDRSEWSSAPATVNAFYSAAKNQITFPAGILQPPFYNPQYSKSLNYGGIGSVIGHEIVHGFDDRGRLYDKEGNMREWWSEATSGNFQKRATCIINQYSRYMVEGTNLTINGRQTQGENIADNGGIKAAFKAYQKWVQKNGTELPLPGTSLNHDKLFFVNFAQVWCNKMNPEYAVSRILSGVHSPDKYRVIGSLSNLDDFTKTFGCSANTNMNPDNKCIIW